MSIRTGVASQTEQELTEGVSPQVAYFLLSAGKYFLAAGAKQSEANAWLVASAGVEFLNNSPVSEDRIPYLVSSTKVLI
jgi:hypothetical protein